MCLYSQEVASLIRDALEPRVRQFQEARYQKIQPKTRKDFTLTAPLCLEGTARMRSVPKRPKIACCLVGTYFATIKMNEIRMYYICHVVM